MPHARTSTEPLRAAVVGVGYLGRFHAAKYAALADVELAAVVDVDAARAGALAAEFDCVADTDHRRLCGRVDIASVVVPTGQHFRVARDLLEAGIDVLVEKPFTATVAEGRRLVALARERGRVLQVGHLERFNPAIEALGGHVARPGYIEAQRLSPFQPRGTDVSVVLDLMIHDIDLILGLVDAPIRHIEASGLAIRSPQIDIASARLDFADGCVARLVASRVSTRSERRMFLLQDDIRYTVDLSAQTLDIDRPGPGAAVRVERHEVIPGDALATEIRHFVDCVRAADAPRVGGEQGLRALETAMAITRQIEARLPGKQPWMSRAGFGQGP